MATTSPDFRDGGFLEKHAADIIAFYLPRCVDPDGGFFCHFKDDGELYDKSIRHLVSTTRFIVNYSSAYCHATDPGCPEKRSGARATLPALSPSQCQHRRVSTVEPNPQSLKIPADSSLQCGNCLAPCSTLGAPTPATLHTPVTHGCSIVASTPPFAAFVLLAYSCAVRAVLGEASWVHETYNLLESNFWEPAYGLYKDEMDVTMTKVDSYRGQNANMHMCELFRKAMIEAYSATGDHKFLDRGLALAEVDLEYNKDELNNLFRPWGVLTGHLTEWTKLLLLLRKHCPAKTWLLSRAQSLFDAAMHRGWDTEETGLHYSFPPESGQPVCNTDKYYWVHAESFAAAAMLAEATGHQEYWSWYDKIWGFTWRHLVDHTHGGWYRWL
eukprot:gene5762-1027_t